MKKEKEIEEMLSFIGYFNDGLFMNQDYRRGIQDALSFVLYSRSELGIIKRHLSPSHPKTRKEKLSLASSD